MAEICKALMKNKKASYWIFKNFDLETWKLISGSLETFAITIQLQNTTHIKLDLCILRWSWLRVRGGTEVDGAQAAARDERPRGGPPSPRTAGPGTKVCNYGAHVRVWRTSPSFCISDFHIFPPLPPFFFKASLTWRNNEPERFLDRYHLQNLWIFPLDGVVVICRTLVNSSFSHLPLRFLRHANSNQ